MEEKKKTKKSNAKNKTTSKKTYRDNSQKIKTKETIKKIAHRETDYIPEFDELAFKFCLLGSTNAKLADFFNVSESTIDLWIVKHKSFSGSIKKGREQATANVAHALYSRAIGYSHDAVKIFCDPKTGAEQVVPYVEHYPPDVTAGIFYMKVKAGDVWNPQNKVEHSGELSIGSALEEARKRVKEQ